MARTQRDSKSSKKKKRVAKKKSAPTKRGKTIQGVKKRLTKRQKTLPMPIPLAPRPAPEKPLSPTCRVCGQDKGCSTSEYCEVCLEMSDHDHELLFRVSRQDKKSLCKIVVKVMGDSQASNRVCGTCVQSKPREHFLTQKTRGVDLECHDCRLQNRIKKGEAIRHTGGARARLEHLYNKFREQPCTCCKRTPEQLLKQSGAKKMLEFMHASPSTQLWKPWLRVIEADHVFDPLQRESKRANLSDFDQWITAFQHHPDTTPEEQWKLEADRCKPLCITCHALKSVGESYGL